MLINNIDYLLKNHRHLYEFMKKIESDKELSNIQIVTTRSGLPTIKVIKNDVETFIHSKYDPIKESERILKKYNEELTRHTKVIFFGMGLGYHVDLILKKFPNKSFYIYEPDPKVFYTLTQSRNLIDIFEGARYYLLIPENEAHRNQLLYNFSTHLTDEVLIIVHPSYEHIYKKDLEQFNKILTKFLKEKKFNLSASISFQKKWTLNSVKNFKYTLKSPNILSNIDNNPFKNNPVIIVSAGPSLNDELELLKQIKKEGSAYILAVGSANKTLINNGIEPDAVCTYDPKPVNYQVFDEMVKKGIDYIPMIYGTTVGYETLEKYKGPKLYMITSQDTVTPYFFDKVNYEIVDDAPSIAVITLQMLNYLKASPILFVGQNLAYRENKSYAMGINHEIQQDEDKYTVKSVSGRELFTNETFLQMKSSIEHFLSIWGRNDVINTTVEGANIKHAPFLSLEEAKKKYLTKKVVKNDWFQNFSELNITKDEIISKLDELNRLKKRHLQITEELAEIIDKIENNKNSSEQKLERLFQKMDKIVKKLETNKYYQIFVKPIMKIEEEQIYIASRKIKYETSGKEKAHEIVIHFGQFTKSIITNTNYINPAFEELLEEFK